MILLPTPFMTLFSPHNNFTTTRDCTGLLFKKENVMLRKGTWFSLFTPKDRTNKGLNQVIVYIIPRNVN
jgi:hypothetical protein